MKKLPIGDLWCDHIKHVSRFWFTFEVYAEAYRGSLMAHFERLAWQDLKHTERQVCPMRPVNRPPTENNG